MLQQYNQQQLLGHKGRCFDVRYSYDGNVLLTASEDGTAILWDLYTRKIKSTLVHNKESEVLRATFLDRPSSLVATGGADGRAIVWKTESDSSSSTNASKYTKQLVLEHEKTSQIYACESLSGGTNEHHHHSSNLVTAADSVLYLWDLASTGVKPYTLS